MKIKSDFVTNSSSSSFIIAIESDLNDKIEFVNKLNEYFGEIDQGSGLEEDAKFAPSIAYNDVEETSSNIFTIEGYVPYYNSYDDLPKHIKNLVLDFMSDREGLSKFGIKNLDFKITDRNAP